MVKKDKKQLALAVVVVLILFAIFTLFGYMYREFTKSITDNVNYELITEFGDSNKMYINNILPVSSTIGKNFDGTSSEVDKQGYKEISIKNNYNSSIDFSIFLKKNNSCSNEISDSYVMFYLTDGNNKPVDGFNGNVLPTYSSLNVLKSDSEAKLLYSGSIKAKSSEKFILRVWVSDLYSLEKNDECFSFDLFVKSK